MNFQSYLNHFEQILSSEDQVAPYNDPHFLDYTKLNWSRMNRWFKTSVINPELEQKIKSLKIATKWVLITEPWCGDAAHSVPFIKILADKNQLIKLEIQLRDNGSEIDNYLTNGGKSIPKLIIRNEQGEDLAVWGPRPEKCQEMFDQQKADNVDFETMKTALQKWYNADKGESIQKEFLKLPLE